MSDDAKADIPHHRTADTNALEAAYSIGIKLGQGSFGTVRLVQHKETSTTYACKILRKRRGAPTAYEQIQREVAIMKRVRHPHIIQLKEVYETPKKFFLIMEYCKGGELVQRIKSRRSCSESDVCTIMYRLVDAIAYLHDQGIVHRDIKPENILVSSDIPIPLPGSASQSDLYNIKVSDFGLATSVDTCTMMENIVGTPLYMAPEIVQNLGYSAQCDIWSIGVLMYLLLCGYRTDAEKALQQMISEGRIEFPSVYWADVSPGARNLCESTLKIDPAKRITAREILMHPWLNGEASATPISATVLDLMRSYNAERRFRKIVNTILATVRLRSSDGTIKSFPAPLEKSSQQGSESSLSDLSQCSSHESIDCLTDDDPLGIKPALHGKSLVYIKTAAKKPSSTDRDRACRSVASLTAAETEQSYLKPPRLASTERLRSLQDATTKPRKPSSQTSRRTPTPDATMSSLLPPASPKSQTYLKKRVPLPSPSPKRYSRTTTPGGTPPSTLPRAMGSASAGLLPIVKAARQRSKKDDDAEDRVLRIGELKS
ncbi:hypothetical protein SpCBS45565_g05493 [Spizellomyces sp. 'palustris']|nr:hypothetical protein SpCBS45565_g05493 [Spizellomyces sp. 'palustris']